MLYDGRQWGFKDDSKQVGSSFTSNGNKKPTSQQEEGGEQFLRSYCSVRRKKEVAIDQRKREIWRTIVFRSLVRIENNGFAMVIVIMIGLLQGGIGGRRGDRRGSAKCGEKHDRLGA